MSAKNPNNSRPSSTKRPKSNNEKKKEKKDNKQETCRPSYLADKGRGGGRAPAAESECCAELKRRHEGRAQAQQAQREQRPRREPQSPGPSAGRRRRKGGPVCAPICSTVRDGGGGAGRGSAPTAGPPRAGPCVGGAPAGPCVGAAPAGGGDAKPEARSTQAQESADVMPVSREAPPPEPPPPPPPPEPEPEPEEPEPEPEPEPPPPPPPEKKPKERQRRCCWGCLTCCFRRDKKKRKKKKKKKPPPPPPPPEPEPKPEPEPEPEPEADAAGEPRSMSVNGGGSVGGGRGSVGSGGAATAPWQRAGSQGGGGGSLGPSWPPPPGAPGGSLGPSAQRPPYGAGWGPGPVPKAAMYCVGGPVGSAAPSFGGGAPAGSRAAGALPACVDPSLARRPCDRMPPSCKEESAMAGRAKCVKVKKPRKKSAKRRLCTSVCPPALPPSCKMRSCPYSQRLTYPIGELPYSASRRHEHCIPEEQAYKPNFSQKGGQCKENR